MSLHLQTPHHTGSPARQAVSSFFRSPVAFPKLPRPSDSWRGGASAEAGLNGTCSPGSCFSTGLCTLSPRETPLDCASSPLPGWLAAPGDISVYARRGSQGNDSRRSRKGGLQVSGPRAEWHHQGGCGWLL